MCMCLRPVRFRLLLALVILLLVAVAPAQAASNDNHVETGGTGHAPATSWNVCDSQRPYRGPAVPRADQSTDIRATGYPNDLTAVNVWYTTNPAATVPADWTTVSAAYESPDVTCSRGVVSPWLATLPASSTQVWYKIEYIDGTDSKWQRVSEEGAAGVADGDGGWTTDSTDLTYAPPGDVWVDDDFNSSTPGWDVDHFADLTDGLAAVATGGEVNVAAGTYAESQVLIDRAMTVQGAGAATTIIDGGAFAGLSVPGLVHINAAADVTFDGFTVRNAGDSGANFVRVGIYAASPVAGVTYTIAHNTILGSNNPEDEEDYGFYTNGGLESLVFQYNTITQTGSNAILIERHPGATDVSFNAWDRGVADSSVDPYFNMNYGSAHVTTLQRVANNTIDMGTGAAFDSANRGFAISFAGDFTADSTAGGFTNVEIEDNTIVNLLAYRRGIGLWNNAPGDGAAGYIRGAVISGNTLSGPATADGSIGIRLLGLATNAVISGNSIDKVDVVFRGQAWNGHIASGAVVEHNNFSNSPGGLVWDGAALLDAEENWWGAACGAGGLVPASGNVDFDPWWALPGGPTLVSAGSGGELIIPTGATQAEAAAVFACAPVDGTVTFQGGDFSGGYTITTNGLDIRLNGSTIGAGSPAFTIDADDVSLIGPGLLDGGGAPDPGVLVLAGADNFTLKDAHVTDWEDGVRIAGSVISFKMARSYIYSNSDDGLSVESGAAVDGVLNVEGNLFKDNGGAGVDNAGATADFNVQYNSWGDIAGPTGVLGDGTAGSVNAANFTFIEPFVDMAPGALATAVDVIENASFTAKLKMDATNVYGFAFKVTYDPQYLSLTSTVLAAPWSGRCSSLSAVIGVISYRCQLLSPDPAFSATAATIATLDFTAAGGSGNGPWTSHLDIAHEVADTGAAAEGGAKIFVNNAGYGAPSAESRDITDADDGAVSITGIAQYQGFVDLQGRQTEAGATVKVYSLASKTAAVQHAQATSAAGGGYTTAYLPPRVLTVGTQYWIVIDRPLFLATTAAAASDYSHSKLLLTRPYTALGTVILLGGDATDDELVDVSDASCIGGAYSGPSVSCGGVGNADVNEDGIVDILDLSLMGGNYSKTSSPWTP